MLIHTNCTNKNVVQDEIQVAVIDSTCSSLVRYLGGIEQVKN
jgi:hypothetical protein